MNGFEKLILRLRRVHEVEIVLHRPDSSSLTDVASAKNIVGRQSCPTLTPFRNYLNQVSAFSQPLPGLPQKQRLLPEVCVKVAQLCLTLCDPMKCSLPGASVLGDSPGKNTGVGSLSLLQRIFPTEGLNPGLLHYRLILYQLSHKGSPRILEWVASPFSSRFSQPRNRT